MKTNLLFNLAGAGLLALFAAQASGGWTQTIDDSAAQFSSWNSDLQEGVDPSAVGGTYRYILDWGDSDNASGIVKYQLSGVPAGNRLYHVSFSSPASSTFGTSGNIAQWHVFDVAADGMENFNQKIPWAGQFGTNKQWLGPNSGYNPGALTQLGPGPQSDASLADGSLVWLNGSSGMGQPYIYIRYQPFYTSPIAFDAITVSQYFNPDLNGSGLVDVSDIQQVAINYLNTGVPIIPGDANIDGIVDVSDIQLIAAYYLQSWPPPPGIAGTGVPEPSSVAMLGVGMLGWAGCAALRRRRAFTK
ncbi:MAG: PEP-CTERM sorting domain-containing protein [Planctomycetia bacterium]|nr:PEP-CTERM sorting domain-containing protein [Planctomycetia bacterium]